MKKIILALAAACLLAGCSSSGSSSIDTKISDDGTIVTVNDSNITITKQDLFETYLSNYGADEILNEALIAIAEELVTDTTGANESVEETIASYTELFGDEESLEEYIISLGYESIDEYKEEVLLPNAMQTELMYLYIEENIDALVEEYGFTYVQYFALDTESDAMTVINNIDLGTYTFEEAASQNGVSIVSETLISTLYDGDTVDDNIVSITTNFTAEGMYSAPITLSDGTYGVVQITSKDMTDSMDTIKETLIADEDFIINAESYYLRLYNFEVYESTLKDDITEISEKYFTDDTEE